jgi:hypothetical protein
MGGAEHSEALRRRLLNPWTFRLYLWKTLPLAACAGLRLDSLDNTACTVSLPGGWRTQNPFSSTYFAAQVMAAEMSTGAPAMVLVQGAPASVAMILREIRAVFTKRIQGRSRYTFEQVGALQEVVERAAQSGESETFTALSRGRTLDGTLASEFEVTWSFKRRS